MNSRNGQGRKIGGFWLDGSTGYTYNATPGIANGIERLKSVHQINTQRSDDNGGMAFMMEKKAIERYHDQLVDFTALIVLYD